MVVVLSMNKRPEESGCWYCMTDYPSPLGWLVSFEFDCVLHAECLEYEHNENRSGNDMELDIFLKEFGYET